MISTIYAAAIAAILHGACVDIDEQVRYEQLAMLAEARAAMLLKEVRWTKNTSA